MLLHTAERPKRRFSRFCTLQKHQMKLFHASAHDRNTIRRKEYALVRVGRTGFMINNQLLFIIQTFILLRYKVCGPPANHFLKGLAFPRSAKVISRKVWHFRARRKSFPERFSISALGESYFPSGLAFPRLAKVISRKVLYFRAWRKSFPERFCISALGESYSVIIYLRL